MLAVSPKTRDDCDRATEFLETPCGFTINSEEDEFPEFAEHGDLLDIIDFDDLFDVAGDVLPDLETLASTSSSEKTDSQGDTYKGNEEVVSKRDHDQTALAETLIYDGDRKRKSSSKNQGKWKVKVDWTAELHRRFVEAVEQLGVDKAVPSRILELIEVNCLTRHNVASHLQKYRSRRKYLLAREAEAANWTRKRHFCRVDNVNGRNKNGWFASAPTLGFPPPPPVHHHHFTPLHVWGHPTVDQSVMPHVWPKLLYPPNPYWHPIHNGTTPYFPTVATRLRTPPVAGIPHAMPPHHKVYKPYHGFGPSKESVDAAIGDVLTRPWLPLPLGLKPPAVDGVITELHRHGVSEVPPTMFCA